jgi:hypothetical protein
MRLGKESRQNCIRCYFTIRVLCSNLIKSEYRPSNFMDHAKVLSLAPRKCLICLQHWSSLCHQNTREGKSESAIPERQRYIKHRSSLSLIHLIWRGKLSSKIDFQILAYFDPGSQMSHTR